MMNVFEGEVPDKITIISEDIIISVKKVENKLGKAPYDNSRDALSRFDRFPICDRQTDRQTDTGP